ncbi:uncharacterized protein L969DRAFT_606958 [Mixia osmundae IAM 14324]|uniref:uncharacterized protein n=1 Tax=Mixia osmundae (strain CBS 9802 / IAM 14324 / JCM 22182 / KY 12970) TaxID=764103 RepID=UPI0004A559F9|nr:uncharacterized protein L969DRAFT_606958 [Mixia osmundae IAM 14324]KEI42511.1 hypothetical protein L969DRAFT_606958 [Mixia osmundae IAM 14324]
MQWHSCTSQTRSYATSTPARIFLSHSTNPYWNLAYEDWLFRKTPADQHILLLYRNAPCIVIGRNQNPWNEINLSRLRQLRIPLVRRRSGGGTVYHDLGNTNYCLFMPRASFDRRQGAELVSSALNALDVPTRVNERSAFKLINARAYHHGTMLLRSDLTSLRGLLKAERPSLKTKGVGSVSSSVRNLSEWNAEIGHESFVRAVAERYAKAEDIELAITEITEQDMMAEEFVSDNRAELLSWAWVWGQTPEFTIDLSHQFDFGSLSIRITSKHALITAFDVEQSTLSSAILSQVEALGQAMIGNRYDSASDLTKESHATNDQIRSIVQWLSKVM